MTIQKLIGDIRERVVASQAALALLRKGKMTEVSCIFDISKKLVDMGKILTQAEEEMKGVK